MVRARAEGAGRGVSEARRYKTKYVELHEAVVAMRVDDPPLKWTIPQDVAANSMRSAVVSTARRHGVEIKAFAYDGKIYVVRLK